MKAFEIQLLPGVGIPKNKLDFERVTIAAKRFCTTSAFVMFYDENEQEIAAYPTWRVIRVIDDQLPIS